MDLSKVNAFAPLFGGQTVKKKNDFKVLCQF